MEDRRESELKTFCSKNILVILGFSSIIAVIALLALGLTQNKPLPENVKFGIVLDAGSSHTSLYIYKWPAEKENDTGVVSQVEECKLKGPGISEFAKNLGEIDIYLEACMERARTVVPKSQHAETPVYLGATAGMRLLRMKNENLASKILSTVAESITRYPFDFQGARIITGQEEGAYGWITINYLLDKFIQKSGWFNLKPRKGDTQETYGALDLGGASTQITFVPQNQVLESPENTLHFRLYGKNYSVYTHSFLCYGKDQALLQKLTKDLKNTNGTIHEPCFHSGYQRRMNVSHLYEAPCTRRFLMSLPFPELEIQGTGDFQKCQQSIRPLFNTSYCPYSRCSFDGVFLPLPQGDFAHNVFKRAVINSSEDRKTLENVMKAKVSQAEKWTYKDKFGFWLTFWIWFLGNLIKAFSAFYYVMGFLNLTSEEGSSQSKMTSTLEEFCSRPWAELQMYFGDVKEKYLSEYCFSGTYILTLLLSGYHFTAETWKNIHFMGKVQSTSVGWTLGYMLNLTNMIPSEEPSSTRLSHSTYVFLMVLFSLILVIVVIIGLFVCHRPSYFWKDMV